MAHPVGRRTIGTGSAAVLSCVFSNMLLLLTTNCRYTDGAQGLFVFGDSYTDTGENMNYPYGMTWPGDGTAHRSSDGRNEVDYIADKFGVPSPTPWEWLDDNGNPNNGGANFGVGGAGVTDAYGYRSLEKQVDAFEALVKKKTWTESHLSQSVALISIGVNDYTYYNQNGNGVGGVSAYADTVVDKMGAALQRIQRLGITHIMVEDLAPMACMPFATLYVNGETECVTSDLLDTETNLHNQKLQAKVDALNGGRANIVMLNLYKALRTLFENGPAMGFTQPYSRCCKGNCGSGDEVCNDPSNHVIFDSIHPTQAAWKAVTDLYTYSQSYTVGPTLALWKLNNNL
ncbi:GDSL esterase/lipase At5g03610 [Physcomitrium patens]|uniref:GDSL esterase/lipase n=1 Tax=Physcomitrium patens TaxID=3218 RepID=A0A2K1KCM8_PHYPA|nr:GDSL esterase/lipase At5g03610-like [Physcomitrium patens]PNR51532.1 hypothetical protein PHYPA_010719 [Physcomitrium patens]|eukprot:XP_024379615.1 GDSL esterase/lipase At5g03610-like [Physcomitrella patens]